MAYKHIKVPAQGEKITQLQKLLPKVQSEGEFYEVRQLIMNPKSITMGQLYGSFDEATHEWEDGILCRLFREAVYDPVERQNWVVFDGPVDALVFLGFPGQRVRRLVIIGAPGLGLGTGLRRALRGWRHLGPRLPL